MTKGTIPLVCARARMLKNCQWIVRQVGRAHNKTKRFEDFRGRIKSVEQILKPGLRNSFVSIRRSAIVGCSTKTVQTIRKGKTLCPKREHFEKGTRILPLRPWSTTA